MPGFDSSGPLQPKGDDMARYRLPKDMVRLAVGDLTFDASEDGTVEVPDRLRAHMLAHGCVPLVARPEALVAGGTTMPLKAPQKPPLGLPGKN